jgi:hypothetical protein
MLIWYGPWLRRPCAERRRYHGRRRWFFARADGHGSFHGHGSCHGIVCPAVTIHRQRVSFPTASTIRSTLLTSIHAVVEGVSQGQTSDIDRCRSWTEDGGLRQERPEERRETLPGRLGC